MAGPIINYSDLIGPDDTFDDLLANVKLLKSELLDLAKVMKKTMGNLKPNDESGIQKIDKDLQGLERTQKKILKTEKALLTAKKKTIDLTNEELVQRETEKIKQRERIQRAKQEAIVLKEEKNNIASLRAQLALATLDWKKFTAAELKNTKEGKKAIKNKKDLTRQLKKLEKATGDNRRNVGNYSSALSGLNGVMVGFGGNVGASLGAITGMVKGIKAATSGMKLFRLAIISTGIGALVLGIISLISYFKRSQQGIDSFNKGLAQVSAFVTVIIDRFTKFGSAIAAVFSGDFSGAMDLATEAFTGLGDEISRAVTEAALLQKAIDDLAKLEVFWSAKQAERITKVANLRREAKEIQDKDAASALKKLQEAHAIQVKIEDREIGFAERRAKIAIREFNLHQSDLEALKKKQDALIALSAAETKKATALRGLQREMNTLIAKEEARRQKVIKATAAQKKGLEELAEAAIKASMEEEEALIKANELRLQAISKVIKEVENLEAQGIEDKQERLLALEELRYKAETELREAQFDELKANSQGIASELESLEKLSDRKKEQQEIDHLTKMKSIRETFFISEYDERQAIIDQQDAENEAEAAKEAAIDDRKVKASIARNKKIKESNQELIDNISATAEKVGELIIGLYEKQADLAGQAVTDQEKNLSTQEERAQKGLTANLAFEKKELANRQAEQIRAQKDAENAARILTLFNLVSAYAGSGDKNALARGLVDFALLTSLAAGIGFEEGGFTGADGSNSTVKGVVHANEYVVTAADTARFGLVGKSGGEFGEAMGDYFNPMSTTLTNPYQAQKESFKQGVKQQVGSNQMTKELIEIKKHLKSQPNYSAQIVEVQKQVYQWVLRENKQNMTKIQKEILRAAKKNG